MAKFCKKCGSRLDETTGLCTNCDVDKTMGEDHLKKSRSLNKKRNQKESRKKTMKKKKRIKRKKKRHFLLRLVLVLLFLMIIFIGVAGGLMHFDVIESPAIEMLLDKLPPNAKDDPENYEAEYIDADEYFQENSEISSTIKASESKKVQTEAEIRQILRKKGFKEYPIVTEYDMDGIYHKEKEISKSSSDKHPLYTTYYYTENEELWSIIVIDGDIMANPISYNMQADAGKQIMVSESEALTSYDSVTNQFYRTIPDKEMLNVKVVKKINTKTLEQLTVKEMNK